MSEEISEHGIVYLLNWQNEYGMCLNYCQTSLNFYRQPYVDVWLKAMKKQILTTSLESHYIYSNIRQHINVNVPSRLHIHWLNLSNDVTILSRQNNLKDSKHHSQTQTA